MISRAVIAVLVIMTGLAGCSTSGPSAGPSTKPTLTVTSPAFAAGQAIPAKYSCDGAGISPPLAWHGAPANTRELALVVDDPDAPGGTFTHWVLLGIPAHTTSIAEGSAPANSTAAANSSGDRGYAPLCPPNGTHHYRFTVYALSAIIHPPDHSLSAGLAAISDHTLAWGRLTGTYHRG